MLHLRPFTDDDARTFLSEQFPAIDPTEVLAHLERCGIESLYENPLTLRMLGEVAQHDGPLPETRAELFHSACRVMLKEENPRHHGIPMLTEAKSNCCWRPVRFARPNCYAATSGYLMVQARKHRRDT